MFIDSHIHFERFVDDLEAAISQIETHRIFCAAVSLDLPSYELTLEVSKKSELLLPAFGVHPVQSKDHVDRLDVIRNLAHDALMLGEIGLDREYIEQESDYTHQPELFTTFLEVAEKHDTIMTIHVAGAESEALSILASYKVTNVIFHDYYGPPDLVREIIDRGYYYSFDRSYLEEYESEIPGWKERREIVATIPDDRILTETDGPNRPPNRLPFTSLKQVIDNVASLRGTTPKEIESQTRENFLRMTKRDSRLSRFSKVLEHG